MNINDCWGGWQELSARNRGGIDDDKGMLDMEIVGDNIIRIGFCDMGPPYKSGPRKGRARFLTKTKRDVYIQGSDIEAEKSTYEKDTGECSQCLGIGETVKSCCSVKGTTMRECAKCGGSGHASVKP